jgi:hypothetical protein
MKDQRVHEYEPPNVAVTREENTSAMRVRKEHGGNWVRGPLVLQCAQLITSREFENEYLTLTITGNDVLPILRHIKAQSVCR